MDPVSPPGTPEVLARRHRWLAGPPKQAAADQILRRHNHPGTTTHRFLSYNTFLVPGLQIGAGLAGATRLALVAAQLGLLAGGRVARIRPRDLLGELGAGGQAPHPPRDSRLSPLLGRLDPGAGGERTLDLVGKASRRIRAVEIARLLASEYDLAALCEVFTSATRGQMLQAMKGARQVADAAGPPRGSGVGRVGSGLLSVCLGQGRRLVRAAWRPFTRHGDPLREGDAWATKGVLLLEVDLGPGRLELFSTHLLAGNDLLASRRRLLRLASPLLSDAQLLALRLSQVDDLLAFYREQHNPQNVAMVVGDFNLSAQDPDTHAALQERMASAKLRDAWPHPGWAGPEPRGDTHATGGGGRSSRLNWLGEPDRDGYLDDRVPSPRPTDRIDYIFVEEPTAAHTFNLDLTRIRRRAFPREPRGQGGERYLSDHVGLDTTLIASPVDPHGQP